MDVRDLNGTTALVTGAASGIGRASALAFAERGATVVICDVDTEGLEDTASQIRSRGNTVLAKRVDVAAPDQMAAFAETVHDELGAVDVLMNNAGVGLAASFADTTLDDWSWIIGINLLGVVHGCHYFVPPMIARGAGGHVVNVASMAAYTPNDALVAYTTTKYAVLGFSESLRSELRPHGIGVSALCPGIINTAITRSARARGTLAAQDVRDRLAEAYQRRDYTPERVARDMLTAIQRDRTIAPSSPEAWVVYYLKRLSPALVRWLGSLGQRRLTGLR